MIATSVCPITAHAVVSCDQFKAGLLEATTFYTYPAPKYEHMVDDNKGFQHWDVTIFGDVGSSLSCQNGLFSGFLAEAKSATKTQIASNPMVARIHAGILAAMGFHAYGLPRKQALEMRDRMVQMSMSAKEREAELPVEGGKASVIVGDVPSWAIETED